MVQTRPEASLTHFAVLPGEPVGTHTSVAARLLPAGAPVAAGPRGAGVEPDWRHTHTHRAGSSGLAAQLAITHKQVWFQSIAA